MFWMMGRSNLREVILLDLARSFPMVPPSDDPEWSLDIFPADSYGEYILLDANNPSGETVLPNNGMFALVTANTIDFADTSAWGVFDAAGASSDYLYNPNIIRTYICYAGETGNGTWDVVFR